MCGANYSSIHLSLLISNTKKVPSHTLTTILTQKTLSEQGKQNSFITICCPYFNFFCVYHFNSRRRCRWTCMCLCTLITILFAISSFFCRYSSNNNNFKCDMKKKPGRPHNNMYSVLKCAKISTNKRFYLLWVNNITLLGVWCVVLLKDCI